MKSLHVRRIFIFLTFVGLVNAAELHLTPDGAGRKDGANWENALDQAALSRAVNDLMMPGDRLLLGGGTYQGAALTITAGGSAGRPKTISGVDRGAGLPVFAGEWSIERPDKGPAAVRIGPGVSHVVFEKLRIRGYCFSVLAPSAKDTAARSHLAFDDVDMERFRHGFYLADCDDLRLTACDLKRYSKHGFRFDQGCDRVTLRRCTADCSEGDAEWENKTELFPFGFIINDSGAANREFVFEDCVARNNMMPLQKGRYKNGDGFVVEGNSADVSFLRCRSFRNQDGGFDLKVPDVRLTDCVAIGNKRAYRIWTTGTLTNCLASGGDSSLWCNGGPVTASRCTFHASSGFAVMTDDKATLPITLHDCIIALLPDAEESQATSGQVLLNATVVTGPGRSDKDAAFSRPDPLWDGLGDWMNSRAYPTKGFNSAATRR